MIHQPPPDQSKPQSVDTVIADLTKQRAFLDQSLDWMKNLSTALQQAKTAPFLDFCNVSVITPTSRHVEIGLILPVHGKPERIHATTIACSYSKEEMLIAINEDLDSIEILNRMAAQRWLMSFKTRPFEVWTIPDKLVWQGDETKTMAWMTKHVRDWLKYWFKHDFKARFVQRQDFAVTYLGKRESPH